MQKTFGMLVIAMSLFLTPCYAAEWAPLSQSFLELEITALAIHENNPKLLFAGAGPSLYQSADGGMSWKRILSLKGKDNEITSIYLDAAPGERVYVTGSNGAQVSEDGGRNWKSIFKGKSGSKKVYCIRKQAPDILWLGTEEGLFFYDKQKDSLEKPEGLPKMPVYSILLADDGSLSATIATAKGLYRSHAPFQSWERILPHTSTAEENISESETTSLEQFDVEELVSAPHFSNMIYLKNQNQFYAGSFRGVLTSHDSKVWNELAGQTLPDRKINFITASTNTFYVATSHGVFQWQAKSGLFRELEGLPSKDVSALAYSKSGDYLLAGTKKGLYKLLYPELNFSNSHPEMPMVEPESYLDRFNNEPSIQDVQKAAIAYAEVDPNKIENWRAEAAKKALLPKLSLSTSVSNDENIDLDRGGTADPDKFIKGPEEKSQDWSVGVSWDLSELIWNPDQTSIDTRSRLMVELRDDVLNEVTHLYFERRKLQIEMLISPPRELPLQVEKRLRLDELTAEIDGLTGGYLTRVIQKAH